LKDAVAAKMDVKNERRGKSHLLLQSLLHVTVEERELAAAANYYVCGLRIPVTSGWCVAVQLKKKLIVVKMVLKNGKDG
jgi:hypothetical protein